jgi:hypothetical protein
MAISWGATLMLVFHIYIHSLRVILSKRHIVITTMVGLSSIENHTKILNLTLD